METTKNADEALLRSMGFRSIKGLDVGILQVTRDLKIRYLNTKMGQILNVDRAGMTGRPLADTDKFAWGEGLLRTMAVQALQGQAVEKEVSYKLPDGSARHYFLKAALDGNVVQYLFEDRTPLKQVETMFMRYVSPAVVDKMRKSPDDVAKLLKAERQELSLLYVSLQDFAAVTEKGNPELIRSSLNQFIAQTVGAADKYEAAVTKIQAPTLLFIFGAPIPAPDHPLRALTAALQMRKEHERLHKSWTFMGLPGLGFKGAVHTGPCIIGNIGCARMMDFNVFGWNLDVARALCEAARPGEILLTKAMHDALQPHLAKAPPAEPVKFRDCGRMQLVGLRQDVHVIAADRG